MKAKRHGKNRIPTEDIKTLYVVGLKTLEEIGTIAGMSKQGVLYVLNQIGVDYKGGKVEKICAYCEGAFQVARYIVKKDQGAYCSIDCAASHRSMGHDMKVSSRMGRAAWLMAGRQILPGQVIHHINGDRTDNSLANLQLFNSQGEHMQYHHSLRHGSKP